MQAKGRIKVNQSGSRTGKGGKGEETEGADHV